MPYASIDAEAGTSPFRKKNVSLFSVHTSYKERRVLRDKLTLTLAMHDAISSPWECCQFLVVASFPVAAKSLLL
jgi:hypothetical protein